MKNTLNVILKKHYATCRRLSSLMLISSIFMSTKSFSGEVKEGAGSLQLCRSENNDGTSIGAGGQSGLNCTVRPKAAFSLNSAGDNTGGLGFNSSNTQVTGYENGRLAITAKKAVEVYGKIDMKDNSIGQLKLGLLSKDSKDAINGSQLFSTNENVSKNADNISKNTQSIEKAQNDLEKVNGALTENKDSMENQLSKTNKKIDRGLAASAALTGLFQPYGVGNVNFTAGMGTYGSSVAMAVGSGYRINEHAAVKAGLAYSGGNNVTSNASFNLEW